MEFAKYKFYFLHVYTLFVTSCGKFHFSFLFETYSNGMTESHKFVNAQQTVTNLSMAVSPESFDLVR